MILYKFNGGEHKWYNHQINIQSFVEFIWTFLAL
jgi:hypothetical protein